MLVVLTACGGSGAPLTATLSPASGSSQERLVSVTLAADPAVQVISLQLRGAGFVQVPPAAVSGRAGPGGTSFALAYGEVLCVGRPAPTVVLVGTPSGVREVSVDGDSLLPGLRASYCAAAPP